MNITAIRNDQNPQPLILLKKVLMWFSFKYSTLLDILLDIYPNSLFFPTIVGHISWFCEYLSVVKKRY